MKEQTTHQRARELGLTMGELPSGRHNAITDVAGVKVGHTTLIEGEGDLSVGRGPIRTGVTVIIPSDHPWKHPLFAAPHRLNGNGEMTGLEWVRESGTLNSYIALTNTHSVGVVRDALIAYEATQRPEGEEYWALPVVGETWDGALNDLNGFHVTKEHVFTAIENASSGKVPEGSVGSGTGMVCHGFKGGIGTASRVVSEEDGGYTVGVLVQANHGRRSRLTIDGQNVGKHLTTPNDAEKATFPGDTSLPEGSGSIIVMVATDAPLLPHQCSRLAQRAMLGVARIGGAGENGSGDLSFAFSTANRSMPGVFTKEAEREFRVTAFNNSNIDPLFYAAIEATEEAIVNSMLAADTMTGINGNIRHRLPTDQLLNFLGK